MTKLQHKTLNEFYNTATMIPVIISFAASLIVGFFRPLTKLHYVDAYIFDFSVAYPFILSLIVSILSLTIFLNKFSSISDSWILSILSWFFLPTIFISYIIRATVIDYLCCRKPYDLPPDFIDYMVVLNVSAHLVLLTTTFLNFRHFYKMKNLLPYIIERAKKSNARHEVHTFPSGALMIDIWIKDKFHVIQIDGDSIGLSLNTEETGPFDIMPDKTYTVASEFKAKFERIFS